MIESKPSCLPHIPIITTGAHIGYDSAGGGCRLNNKDLELELKTNGDLRLDNRALSTRTLALFVDECTYRGVLSILEQ